MIASLRGVALCFVLLVAVAAATITPTTAQRVDDGGAPPPGSGDVDVKGYVRVIDGDTIEVAIGGSRMGVGLIGIEAPPVNTDCGRAASDVLRELSVAGLHLKEEPDLYLDERGRRLYRAITPGGRSVALELAARGLVRVGTVGQEHDALVAAAAEAEAAGRGCISDEQQNRPHPAARSQPARPNQATAHAHNAPAVQAPELFSASALAAAPAGSNTPDGFVEQVVASGLEDPTAHGFLPDGRILVAEKRGVVRIVKNGALLPAPFVDLRDRVNDYWDRGMLGLAVDPSFATTGYVYLLYVYENDDGPGPYPGGYSGTKTARLTRVTASGDQASPSSEVVVLGQQVGRSCSNFPAGADCLPADGDGHSVGAIRFAPDGTLFASLGDASNGTAVDDRALRAQSLDSLAGKIFHIGKDGRGVSSNPFWNGNADAIRSKVWALG
jgi:glucose/arabinose dehydrogenase